MQIDSVNLRFASYLGAQKEAIISEWLKLVHEDPAIVPTATLNNVAIKNHMPKIFDDLIETLRHCADKGVAEQAVKDAEEHGAARLMQGYQLPEMLRELKHLRTVLIYQLEVFEERHTGDGMAAHLFIATTLHGFLDEMVIDSTKEFLWSQMSLHDRIARGYAKC